jgi:uroporphyrin-III C-methyltransferase/precorrin-2 dehydrogenase/sirohydrochlorin ferrochelatase
MSVAAHYPAFLRLTGKKVVVVGSDPAAERKARALARCGALVKRVAARRFSARDLDGAALAVCSSGDELLNARVSRLCRGRGVWANVVDRPALCDFIAPAVVRRGPVSVAISTGGASPFLARLLRRRLEGAATQADARLASTLARLRPRLLELAPARRRRLLSAAADAGAESAARIIERGLA